MNKASCAVVDQSDDIDNERVAGLDKHDRFFGQGFREKWTFKETHPGCNFSVLAKLKKTVIPIVCLPKERLCDIRDLKLTNCDNDEIIGHDTKELREDCAKLALLMFCPH